ncbi:hypothetical protein H0H93_010317 [Arthromyces matolae]|nr:hypothetical protein H0H93_010317 [Arthromyces matolae]
MSNAIGYRFASNRNIINRRRDIFELLGYNGKFAILLSTFLVAASPLPLFEESKSLNFRSIPNRGEQVDSSAVSLIVADAPDRHTPSPEDVAETYLAFLRSVHTGPTHVWQYNYKDYIADKRDDIYQGGTVNAAAFPPGWLDAKGQLYIPDSERRYFTKAPSWNHHPHPLHLPEDYKTIIQTDAPLWLHQLILPYWVQDNALLDKHWDQGFEYRWNTASSGQNVWVYVFDSGIDIHNEEFENRATNGWSFDGDYQGTGSGHGTACASQIGGKRFGVAKKVNIVSIRVLDDDGMNGMDHVLLKCKDHKAPCVISMSMTPDTSITRISEEVIEKVKEAAAGNKHSNIVNGIAGRPDVIAVGALDPKHNYQPALYSDYGFVDMWTVATDICLLVIGMKASCNGRSTRSGTSYAAPPIAGMLASLISLEGNLEPAYMKEKIKRMALYNQIPNLKGSAGGGHNLRAYIPPRIYRTPPAKHI